MSEIPLGDVDPCGSRQAGRRSAVTLEAAGPVVGLADGSVRALEDDGTERWRLDGNGSAVTLAVFDGDVLVGERSPRGAVRLLGEGTERWRHETADDVGRPEAETRFFLPFVVDAVVEDGTAYVAARRYERRDGDRVFESAVYAFAPDGTVRWRYEADASPIALAAVDGGVAVAYNRCPGGHDDGLVCLNADGAVEWTWDPVAGSTRPDRRSDPRREAGRGDADRVERSDRRVGDVATAGGGVVATSHADYRGYRIEDGDVDWCVDLATPRPDGDRVYAYPNHVHASASGVVFLTGNTFPGEGRETDERHPLEHTAVGCSPGGGRRWQAAVCGFAHGIATDGDRLVVPIAQHFRDRDPSVHGWRLLDVRDGVVSAGDADGVVTAAALDGDRTAVVEEPVVYHDEARRRGSYALHSISLSSRTTL